MQELAEETMFYIIETCLAQTYVNNIKKECNLCGTCKLCMQASVYEEGTESLALIELSQLFYKTQWVTFALDAFTDKIF